MHSWISYWAIQRRFPRPTFDVISFKTLSDRKTREVTVILICDQLVIHSSSLLKTYMAYLIANVWNNEMLKQAQRRTATETATFIWVLRCNDESSFHLENDFQMNPASSQTWATWGPSGQLVGAIRFLSSARTTYCNVVTSWI